MYSAGEIIRVDNCCCWIERKTGQCHFTKRACHPKLRNEFSIQHCKLNLSSTNHLQGHHHPALLTDMGNRRSWWFRSTILVILTIKHKFSWWAFLASSMNGANTHAKLKAYLGRSNRSGAHALKSCNSIQRPLTKVSGGSGPVSGHVLGGISIAAHLHWDLDPHQHEAGIQKEPEIVLEETRTRLECHKTQCTNFH